MTDTTQDLVDRFSSGSRRAQKDSSPLTIGLPFGGDKVLGLDTLDDPLDDTAELRGRTVYAASNTLPPTPRDSPLKMEMERLRGSPIKAPRRQFRTPRNTQQNLAGAEDTQEVSPVLMSGFDEDFDPLHVFPNDVVRDTKRLGGYQTLLLLSADKLTQELNYERERSSELQKELDALRREKHDVGRLKMDLDELQKQNQSLRSRNVSLELQVNNCQRNDKSDHLARENKLLREKLLKYKNLYDAMVKEKATEAPAGCMPHGLTPPTAPAVPIETKAAMGATEALPARKKRIVARVPSSEEEVEEDESEPEAAPVKKASERKPVRKAVSNEESLFEQLRRLLAILDSRLHSENTTAYAGTRNNDSGNTGVNPSSFPVLASKKSFEHELRPQHLPSKSQSDHAPTKVPNANETKAARVSPDHYMNAQFEEAQSEKMPTKCDEHFAKLEGMMETIKNTLHSSGGKTAEKIVQSCACPSFSATGANQYSQSHTQAPAKNRDISPPVSRRCAVCSGLTSTRPRSQSTPKDDDTRALMGTFVWNNTV